MAAPVALRRHPKSELPIAITRATGARWWRCRFPERGGWRRCRLRQLAGRTGHFRELPRPGLVPEFSRGRLDGEIPSRWGWILGRPVFRRLERRRRRWLGWRRLG